MFRQNVGQAWAGSKIIAQKPSKSVLIEDAMPLTMGLTKGSSDLIGWTSVEITPDMVGSSVAVFTAVECKRSHGGRVTPEQKHFVERVIEAGGMAGVVSDPAAAEKIAAAWHRRFHISGIS